MTTHSPYEDPIIQRLFDALNDLAKGNTTPWAEMFLPIGSMEFPYAPPAYPKSLDGKSAIADYIKEYPNHIALHRVTCDNVFYCNHVRIVEFHAEATAVTTGRDFSMHYVAVIEVEDGLIRTYRDYWNPLVALEAMNGLDALNSMGGTQ